MISILKELLNGVIEGESSTMNEINKERIRRFIKFQRAFGKCPWEWLYKETKHPLYQRYIRIFPMGCKLK